MLIAQGHLPVIHLIGLPLATVLAIPAEALDAKAMKLLDAIHCRTCVQKKLQFGHSPGCLTKCQGGLCPRVRTVYPSD